MAPATSSDPRRQQTFGGIPLLILDEVGYLPIDKTGADLMFQALAARCEKA